MMIVRECEREEGREVEGGERGQEEEGNGQEKGRG